MKVSIIKYNAGNVYSVECALRRLGVTPVVSDSPDVLSQSDKVLFPGVGEASSAMKYLQEHGLDRVIVDLTQPVWLFASDCSFYANTPKKEMLTHWVYSIR